MEITTLLKIPSEAFTYGFEDKSKVLNTVVVTQAKGGGRLWDIMLPPQVLNDIGDVVQRMMSVEHAQGMYRGFYINPEKYSKNKKQMEANPEYYWKTGMLMRGLCYVKTPKGVRLTTNNTTLIKRLTGKELPPCPLDNKNETLNGYCLSENSGQIKVSGLLSEIGVTVKSKVVPALAVYHLIQYRNSADDGPFKSIWVGRGELNEATGDLKIVSMRGEATYNLLEIKSTFVKPVVVKPKTDTEKEPEELQVLYYFRSNMRKLLSETPVPQFLPICRDFVETSKEEMAMDANMWYYIHRNEILANVYLADVSVAMRTLEKLKQAKLIPYKYKSEIPTWTVYQMFHLSVRDSQAIKSVDAEQFYNALNTGICRIKIATESGYRIRDVTLNENVLRVVYGDYYEGIYEGKIGACRACIKMLNNRCSMSELDVFFKTVPQKNLDLYKILPWGSGKDTSVPLSEYSEVLREYVQEGKGNLTQIIQEQAHITAEDFFEMLRKYCNIYINKSNREGAVKKLDKVFGKTVEGVLHDGKVEHYAFTVRPEDIMYMLYFEV